MNCVKPPGQKLSARDFDRQTAELQSRIAILNRHTALGIPLTRPAACPHGGKGAPGPQLICATEPLVAGGRALARVTRVRLGRRATAIASWCGPCRRA